MPGVLLLLCRVWVSPFACARLPLVGAKSGDVTLIGVFCWGTVRERVARGGLAALAVLTMAGGTGAHALERVTLRNGFSYDCVHHQAADADKVRLFLSAGDENFVEVSAAAIAGVETLPDPPVVAAPTATVGSAASGTPLGELLARAGAQHNIDMDLLAAIVGAESHGRARAVSHVGAEGLMQLMPATARAMGVRDALLPEANVAGGTAYLDLLLTRYANNLALALAAYNAGPGAVDKYHGIPPFHETRAYVVRVMNEFKRRKLLAAKTMLASR